MTYVHGIFNVKKCAAYLRGVGVEIDDATEAQWTDAQAAHRYLKKMGRMAREGWDWKCANGHFTYIEHHRGQRRKKRRKPETVCGVCKKPLIHGTIRFYVTLDGRVHDYRPLAWRWRPLDAPYTDGDIPGIESEEEMQ